MKTRRTWFGFSLIEVVIAIAIVTGGVAVILGLLPSMARQSIDSADTQTALRLADSVQVQLVADASGGFDAFASTIPVMTGDPTIGRHYVAERDGSNLRPETGGENPSRGQYFLIVVRRYASPPLAYDSQAGYLATNVVVAWPYRPLTPGGLSQATDPGSRELVSFNLAINR